MSDAKVSKPLRVPKPFKRPNSKYWGIKVKVRVNGKERQIWRSLETENEAEARRRAPVVAAAIKADHHRSNAEKRLASRGSGIDEATLEADLKWWLGVRQPTGKPGRFVIPEAHEGAWCGVIERTLGQPLPIQEGDEEERFEPEREAAALRLSGLVQGTRVPVGTHLADYLSENEDFSPSHVSRVRMCVGLLENWLKANHGEDNLQRLDGRKAEAFLRAHSDGRAVTTVNSYVTALSSYWDWMVRRHWVGDNPWIRLSRKKVSGELNASKRAFTDAELSQLLEAVPEGPLREAMFIGALSGLRMTEIGRLTVADTREGMLAVRASKTRAGVRRFPLHSELLPLVERLASGKGENAYLIDGLPTPETGQKQRGYSLSRDFRDLQRAVGTYDRKEGRRQGDVDFHSLRRWFATKAEQAGQPPHLISAVLGHAEGRSAMIFNYSDGPLLTQLAAVVEAVKLPEINLGRDLTAFDDE